MITNKHFSLLILFLTSICWSVSCSNNTNQNAILDIMSSAVIKASPTSRTLTTSLKNKEEALSFLVVYTGDLDEIMTRESSDFKALVDDYSFSLVRPFQVSDEMKGIVLTSFQKLTDPIDIAKEISQIEEVLMVEVKRSKDSSV